MRAPVGSIRAVLRVALGVLLATTAACGAGVAADESASVSDPDASAESGGGPDSEDGRFFSLFGAAESTPNRPQIPRARLVNSRLPKYN